MSLWICPKCKTLTGPNPGLCVMGCGVPLEYATLTFSDRTTFVPHQPEPGTTTGCGTLVGSAFDASGITVRQVTASDTATDSDDESAQRLAETALRYAKYADKYAAIARVREHLVTVETSPDWADVRELLDWYVRDVRALLMALDVTAAAFTELMNATTDEETGIDEQAGKLKYRFPKGAPHPAPPEA